MTKKKSEKFESIIYHETYLSTVKVALLEMFNKEIQDRYLVSEIFINGEKVIIKLSQDISKTLGIPRS